MSVQAITWAWGLDLPCAQRMVLMVLADYYNPRAESAVFPSQSHIAERSGLSRKHVNTVLGELEAKGLISIIERERDNGGNTSCEYIVHVPEPQKRTEAFVEPHGWIYIVRCLGSVKIGIGRDVAKRLKGLQTSNADSVELVAKFEGTMREVREWEKLAHEHFDADRKRGEWFSTDADVVVAWVEGLIQPVAEGMSPEVTGGLEPEVSGDVTTGDTINQETYQEPPSPPQAGDQGFSDLRKAWPQDHWGNLDNAGGAFAKLSAEDRSSAVRNAAAAALAFTRRKARVPALAAYIRSRVFRDFDGGPEIDGSGSWRITPDRPEWGPWLGWIRSKHGQRGVDSIVKCGFFLAPTRWPEGHERAAA